MLRLTEGESLRLASRVGGALIIGISSACSPRAGQPARPRPSPSSVSFGNVPINTTATRDVSITVDAGYRTQLASGSGINVPFSFDFDTCGTGGGSPAPAPAMSSSASHRRRRPRRAARRTSSSAPSRAAAASRSPTSLRHGVGVRGREPVDGRLRQRPDQHDATRDVTITVDTGYRTQLASGSGINAPFSFDFDTCGAGGGFAGPGTCNVKQRFTPTARRLVGGTTNVFECPIAGGSCIAIPYSVTGTGVKPRGREPVESVDFGDVPTNTTPRPGTSRSPSIPASGTELASGSGINAPFGFDFETCGAGGLRRTRHLHRRQSFSTDGGPASAGTTNVFECPVAGGSCVAIPYTRHSRQRRLSPAPPRRTLSTSATCRSTRRSPARRSPSSWTRAIGRELASGPGINVPFGFDFGTCGAGGGFTGPGTCTVNQRTRPRRSPRRMGTTNVFQCPVAGGSCIAIPYNVRGHRDHRHDLDGADVVRQPDPLPVRP